MNILEVKLAGRIRPNQTVPLPDIFATICRTPRSEYIHVTFDSAREKTKHHAVQADCKEDVFSMAQCLQHQLDGYTGSNSEVNEYYQLIERFMD